MESNQTSSLNKGKEAYDIQRQQKETAQKRMMRRKKIKRIIVWSAIIALIGVFVRYSVRAYRDSQQMKNENEQVDEVRGEFFEAQNRDHIGVRATHPAYNSNPPSGGWHYADSAATGIYDKELQDEQLIHNLEHGHVWISYRPSLDPDSIQKLKNVANRFKSKIVVSVRDKNDSPIALAAWEYVLKLDKFDLDQILGFIRAHRGKGPENIPDMGF